MTEPAPAPDRPPAILVLDIGASNFKAAAIAEGSVLWSVRHAQSPRRAPPYLHLDTEANWTWIREALAEAASRFRLEAIIPCTHGSSAALLAGDALALPVMSYEAEPPPEIAAAYRAVAPPFDETFSPTNPAGLTLARQLFWQEALAPDAFARVTRLLPYPQYWAWRLTGIASAEISSLGAQTHLWNPLADRPTRLARDRGWAALLPPLRPAWEPLGPLRPELRREAGIGADTPVLCGIHDSNANYLLYRGLDGPWTLMSTGTWAITFNPGQPLAALDPARDTVSNTDIERRPVASSRFMVGRELSLVAGADALAVEATERDLARSLSSGALAIPAFTDSGGPLPALGGRGRLLGADGLSPPQRKALALLYGAMMSSLSLDAVGASGRIVIDGPLAAEPLFGGILAALRPGAAIERSLERDGTVMGAALLARWRPGWQPPPPDLVTCRPLLQAEITQHAARWRAVVAAALS